MKIDTKKIGTILLGVLMVGIVLIIGCIEQESPTDTDRDARFKKFTAQYGDEWRVEWNDKTDTPHRIIGGNITLEKEITSENVEELTREFISEIKYLLLAEDSALALAEADYDDPMREEDEFGTWYVFYGQHYEGVPVYGGSVRIIIKNQRIVTIGSDYYPDISIDPTTNITKEEAMEIVNHYLGLKEPLGARAVTLIVFPDERSEKVQYYLTWKVEMPPIEDYTVEELMVDGKIIIIEKPLKAWVFFVDAHTGKIVYLYDAIRYDTISGHVTGMVYETTPDQSQVEVPIAHQDVSILKDDRTPIETVTTNELGDYTSTIPLTGNVLIEAHLTGPYIEVYNEENPDPDATHTAGPFSVPATHDWNWANDDFDLSPNDVETNVFYHANFIHDWFMRGAPFNIEPTPLPTNPVKAYVRIREDCNAFARPGAGVIGFYSGDLDSCLDFGLGADIIYHEYTHLVNHEVYAGVSFEYSGFTGAMDEGWADYFGSSITNDPWHGEVIYGGRNLDTGEYHGSVPVDNNRRFPRDWVGEVHWDGLIFGGALWDTRKALIDKGLGADYTDDLAMRAMKHTPQTFSEYLDAMLIEDGGYHKCTICQAFYDNHGIYSSDCVGCTESPIAVITSPPPTEFNYHTGTIIDVIGTAACSSSQPLDHFVIEYENEGNPSIWLSSGITLTGGGTIEVIDGLLATWDTTGIPDDIYNIRLTVTDAGGNTASFQTTVVIDSLLSVGWPQFMTEYFKDPAAVGNIDPSTPELEVVITSGYAVYVFHADGTLYAPWPLSAGGRTNSAPAIADLDLDGDLEIVVSSFSNLRAWNHDGTQIFTLPFDPGDEHFIYASPSIWDLDNDNDLEIITGGRDGKVYIVHHDGTAFTSGGFTWPQTTGGPIRGTPAIADLDGDGEVEIVAGSEDGNVSAWNLDGNDVPGWPINIGQPVISSPAVGNIDGDANHELEVVVGADDGKVYAWHHNGNAVGGWPVDIPGSLVLTSPALTDLDENGDLEIVISGKDALLSVLEHDGSKVAGWSPVTLPAISYNSPVVGDLDGDDVPEIVIGSYNEKVYAFHPDGTLLSGFPRLTASSIWGGAPLITDLDLDDHPEVIIGSNGVYVWSLLSSHNPDIQDWPTFHHDMRHTGYYGPSSGVVLLFDTSGSMSWKHDGTMGVPETEQRLTLAKEATYPFMELLNDFNSGNANFGIAVFPAHPASYPWSCTGQIVTPMTLITDNSKNTATSTTIPGLIAEDNTPLLAGVETAAGMFGVEVNKAIILLSDGYHNCPSFASVGDPEVTDLIDQLNANSIRVFTIGFGKPTDPDHPLLEEFAAQTTPPEFMDSQFNDVTTHTFDLTTWHPATDLQGTYKAILADALHLDTAADPTGTINAGEKEIFEVKINEHDRRVSFFLSWTTPQQGRLGLTVKASDNQVVPIYGTGIRYHEGNTYKILTVDKSFLQLPGKVEPIPWKIEIDTSGLDNGEHENYQYSVILDSGLKMKTALDKASYKTGDTITLTAKITEAGQPVAGLTTVKVKMTQPTDGIGNWFVVNNVSTEELKQIPEKRGDENLSPLQRKAIFLTDISKVAFPASTEPITIRLYDDGSHSDVSANDGIYTNQFTNTLKEGTYSFYFNSTGPTSGGNAFDRDDVIQKYVTVGVKSDKIEIDVKFDKIVEKEKRAYYNITVTPRDAFGNYLGPGHPGAILLKSSKGEFIDDIKDNLDGTYTVTFSIPDDEKEKNIDIGVNIMGADISFNLADKSDKGAEPDENWWVWVVFVIAFIIIIALIIIFLFRR